jgi:hypothetical protein
VRKIGDRDHDVAKDAQFGAAFPRPAKGKYRFTVTFGGDANTNGKAKKVTFRL